MSEINLKGISFKDEKPNKIRQEGFVPCNLYGNKIKNQQFKIKNGDFIKTYKKAGESSLVNIQIDDEANLKCLIKEVQFDVLTDDFLHVDFYQVDMKEKVTTGIPLNFIGESEAVKNLNGILNINISDLEVECLPADLVNSIDVDISEIKTLNDTIIVNSIKMPNGVISTLNPKDVVASVNIAQEETEENDKKVDDVEVSTEKKSDDNKEEKEETENNSKKD